MKILFTILFFYAFNANATVYYVSNTGSDAANGTSTGTSWQTIAKVNAQTFVAGDQILFKSGDSWNEQLKPPTSGTAGNVITFGAYGVGVKPLITGFKPLTGITNTSGNIWSGTATNSVKNQKTVYINGAIRAKGRYPNTGYLYSSNVATTQSRLVVTGLSGSYAGAELVTFGYQWIIDVNKVSSQVVDTLNVVGQFTYGVTNYSYFFQNMPAFLDLQNEYSYDSATKLISVYSTSLPIVKYSSIDTLIFFSKKNYITLDGLNFEAANMNGIRSDTCNNIIIQNCKSNYNNIGIVGSFSSNITIQNDSILNSFTNGVQFFTPGNYINGCDNLLISNNYCLNSCTYSGMCNNGNGVGVSIYTYGSNNTINNNKIDSSGYIGILWAGINNLIKNNLVNTFCFVKDDGGGIYTTVGSGPTAYDTGSIVRSNIVMNGIGATNFIAAGIYLDDNTNGVAVDSNTVSNCNVYGIFLHTNNAIKVKDNTIIDSIGVPLAGSGRSSSGSGTTDVLRNICYSKNASIYALNFNSGIATTMDYNYYLRPIAELNNIYGVIVNTAYTTLPTWSAASGFDLHSKITPSGITGAAGVLYYNATLTATTTALSGSYIDAKGAFYNNSITLQPFQSAILFVSSIQLPKAFGNLIFQ